MKKYTHAWIAFKAIERLRSASLTDANRAFADYLIDWFHDHKDGVIRGAWYPDEIIKDNSTSHILKIAPTDPASEFRFRVLPSASLLYRSGRSSPHHNRAYTLEDKYNLPERCEALSHAVIDSLRIMEREPKGSALAPTNHHAALMLFMLSHYIADAHMPMHCDARPGDLGSFDLHAAVEQVWEEEVVRFYGIDRYHQRFLYNEQGYPLLRDHPDYHASILKSVEDELAARDFQITWGQGNGNVREYILAVSQYSYLLAYAWLPAGVDPARLDRATLQLPFGEGLGFRQMSLIALADAVDAVARVWLRDLRRYMKWEDKY
jgi:hypothetical protein